VRTGVQAQQQTASYTGELARDDSPKRAVVVAVNTFRLSIFLALLSVVALVVAWLAVPPDVRDGLIHRLPWVSHNSAPQKAEVKPKSRHERAPQEHTQTPKRSAQDRLPKPLAPVGIHSGAYYPALPTRGAAGCESLAATPPPHLAR
jgi:hypothetical protein